MTKPTDDMLRLARECAANYFREDAHWASEEMALSFLSGDADHHAYVRIALAAISQTTELAAELAEQRADGDDDETGEEASFCIAADLRNGDHLKQQEPNNAD